MARATNADLIRKWRGYGSVLFLLASLCVIGCESFTVRTTNVKNLPSTRLQKPSNDAVKASIAASGEEASEDRGFLFLAEDLGVVFAFAFGVAFGVLDVDLSGVAAAAPAATDGGGDFFMVPACCF